MFALAQHYQRTGREAEAGRLMAEYPRFKTTAPPVDDPLLDAVRALNKGPDNLLSEAVTLEARGQLAAAADLQLKALELDPKLTQAHINLISLYGRLGDPAKAEKHYREAIAVNPNAHEAYYNFGVLCYQSKRRGEARAAFEQALAINPGYADAHNNLGTLLEEEGKLAGAAEHFRRAIEMQPSFRLARFHLGRIYANQRRYAEAIEQFKRAVEGAEDESRPAYLYALGATQARAGDASSAAATSGRGPRTRACSGTGGAGRVHRSGYRKVAAMRGCIALVAGAACRLRRAERHPVCFTSRRRDFISRTAAGPRANST